MGSKFEKERKKKRWNNEYYLMSDFLPFQLFFQQVHFTLLNHLQETLHQEYRTACRLSTKPHRRIVNGEHGYTKSHHQPLQYRLEHSY